MFSKFRQRLGPTTRFLLGLAGILALFLLVAGLWWSLPVWPRLSLHVPAPSYCFRVIASTDGRFLVTEHLDKLILWDLPSGVQRKTLAFDGFVNGSNWRSNHANDLLLSSDGQTVVFADVVFTDKNSRHVVKVWKPASAGDAVVLPGARSIQMMSGRNLITRSDNSITVWDSTTGKERKSIPLSEEAWSAFGALAADEELLVVQPQYRTIVVFDAQTLQERFRLSLEPFDEPYAEGNRPDVVLAEHFKLLTSVPHNRIVTVWDLTTGRKRGSMLPPDDYSFYLPVEFSPDGSRLLTELQGPERRMACWDVSSIPFRKLAAHENHAHGALHQSYSPDGQWWCKRDERTRAVLLCSASTLQPESRLSGADTASSPVFAPDSHTIAGLATQSDVMSQWLGRDKSAKRVRLWEVPSGRELASFGNCSRFAYLQNGNVLATWGDDGAIRIWDIPPRRPWWIEYGLPILFVLLVLLGIRHCVRFRRKMGARRQ